MNIAVAPGPSFKAIDIVSYGPDMDPKRIADFYRGYRNGTRDADRLTLDRFSAYCREGHILNCVVLDHGKPAAVFGLELYNDEEHGPWLSFLYFIGASSPGLYARVTLFCLDAAKVFAGQFAYEGPLWFRLIGRPGWRRVVSALGIEMSDEGWICGDQEVFQWAGKRLAANPNRLA